MRSTPLQRRLAALLVPCLGWAALAAGPAGAAPQRPASALIEEEADWVRRDATVSFDSRSAQDALASLEAYGPGEFGRGPALMALGVSGSVHARQPLVDVLRSSSAPAEERAAAALALGELGAARLRGDLDELFGVLDDPEPVLARAAVVALARVGDPGATREVAALAAGDGPLAELARAVRAHHTDTEGVEPPGPYRRLYELRWDAACNFGLVEGRVWRRSLLEELARDERFLQALVLRLVRDVPVAGVKDHLLEILLNGDGVMRVEAAVRMMPAQLDLIMDAGVWRPSSAAEWNWFARTALERELHPFLPHAFAAAVESNVPSVLPAAAAVLFERDTRFEDVLIESLESDDETRLADAAFVVGAVELSDFRPRLGELMSHPDPWVRANAIGALIRMGSQDAAIEATELLGLPLAERPPNVAEYLFEVLARAAPDPEVLEFLDTLADYLSGLDRAAADSILLVHDRIRSNDEVRQQLPRLNVASPLAARCAEGLSRQPREGDIRLMAQMFPRQQAAALNLELATGLARAGHRAPRELLEAAVWTLPFDESVLAAGVVHRVYGLEALLTWITDPPVSATPADVRRLGFAIGAFGGLAAVDRLKRELGTRGGTERPAVQGAVLGALCARTR